MAATTTDRDTKRKVGDSGDGPVKAATKIPAMVLVMEDASGYITNGADTASCVFMGISREQKDNTSGAAGDLDIEFWRTGIFTFACTGMAQANVGDAVYLVDNQTVGLKATTTNDVCCGRIVKFISATEVEVDIADRYTIEP